MAIIFACVSQRSSAFSPFTTRTHQQRSGMCLWIQLSSAVPW
jgi:hypothetical protein